MEIVSWILWAVWSLIEVLGSLLWFLISGWVSTLLQIIVLVGAIFFMKYGWRQAPAEILKQSRVIGRYIWGWIRPGESSRDQGLGSGAKGSSKPDVQIVRVKDFGDVNVSTLLSISVLIGLIILAGI